MIELAILKPADFRDVLSAVRLPYLDEIEIRDIKGLYSSKSMNKKDLDLLSKLSRAGTEHAKSLRGAWVSFAIKAPRYWWSEMDTYCIGRQTLSSTSTMHKLVSRDLKESDFGFIREDYILLINNIRYDPSLSENNKLILMKSMLPESFLQTRVVQLNYQTLKNIYNQRKNHRLKEWKDFCSVIESLDYFEELIK